MVQINALYHDDNKGVKKEFNFKGSPEALQQTVKKFDLNKFMGE